MSRRKRQSPANAAYEGFAPNQARNRRATSQFMYERMLTELSLNRFKWKNLPDTCDERFIEYMLFQNALAVFYKEPATAQFLCTQGHGTGTPNLYLNPTRFITVNTPIKRTLKGEECVPVWANYLRIPDHDIVTLYSQRLAEVDRTVEINLKAMRNTQIIFADENERLSYENVMRQIEEGQPVIKATPAMDMNKIQVFNLGIDKDQVLRLMEVKARMWNEAMTLLGINNSNQDKKERMVADEVSSNNDQITAVRSINLKARKQACEQINKRWGLNISVDWDESADTSAMAMGLPAKASEIEAANVRQIGA